MKKMTIHICAVVGKNVMKTLRCFAWIFVALTIMAGPALPRAQAAVSEEIKCFFVPPLT